MPIHDRAGDELVQRSLRLWEAVPDPASGAYDRPPRVGLPVDEPSLDGLLRRGRARALACLWPSLSTDQRAAALFAASTASAPTHTRSGISSWLLALVLAERQSSLLRSFELTARQWWLAWNDPVDLLPALLRTGRAAAWVRAGAHDVAQREQLRRAAFASPSSVRLPITLLMQMAKPWTPAGARVVASHPDTPTATLLEIAGLPSLSATARAWLTVHPSFPLERVPTLHEDASDAEITAIAGVTAGPARVMALLDAAIPAALGSALVRAHKPATALVTEPTASERAVGLVLGELDATRRPDLVAAALEAPCDAARRALARTVNDPQVLAGLASDGDAETRRLAAERVVGALATASACTARDP